MSVRTLVAAIALASAGLGAVHAQLPGPVRTEDPAESGTGATLVVVAPESLCEPDLELMVTRTIPEGGRRYVFQAPVKPPECRWTIADVRQGEYQAVLQKARGDQRVVAMSRLDVYPGSTWTTTIAPMTATVEGLVYAIRRTGLVSERAEACASSFKNKLIRGINGERASQLASIGRKLPLESPCRCGLWRLKCDVVLLADRDRHAGPAQGKTGVAAELPAYFSTFLRESNLVAVEMSRTRGPVAEDLRRFERIGTPEVHVGCLQWFRMP
jgi:hypothetical protein